MLTDLLSSLMSLAALNSRRKPTFTLKEDQVVEVGSTKLVLPWFRALQLHLSGIDDASHNGDEVEGVPGVREVGLKRKHS